MTIIPLIAEPSQQFQIILDGQECTISVYQRNQRLYLDLDVDATRIVTGAVCLEGVSVVQKAQSQFTGSLHFVDTQGRAAPEWMGLGARWLLVYASAGEVLPEKLRY